MFLNIVLVFLAFFGTFFAIVVTVKLRQVRAASRWPSVSGEIISASVSHQQVTTHRGTYEENEDKSENRNFANITYRYNVGGRSYTCSRLSVGEDLGNNDVQGKLQRYPVGRAVQVFYNPENPKQAVLERNLPEGCAKAGFIGLGLVIGIIAFFGYGLDHAVALIAPHMKNPDKASAVVFAGTFTFLCLWFNVGLWNQGRGARRWPRTLGRIVPVEDPTPQTLIRYGYAVNGVNYESDVVDFGGNKHAHFKLRSGAVIRGGFPDQTVEVFYNPADPAKSCLYTGSSMSWLPLFIMFFMAVVTWYLASTQ